MQMNIRDTLYVIPHAHVELFENRYHKCFIDHLQILVKGLWTRSLLQQKISINKEAAPVSSILILPEQGRHGDEHVESYMRIAWHIFNNTCYFVSIVYCSQRLTHSR